MINFVQAIIAVLLAILLAVFVATIPFTSSILWIVIASIIIIILCFAELTKPL
jgi:hypothetical protein